MTARTSALKGYQKQAIKELGCFLELAARDGVAQAFMMATRRSYLEVRHAKDIPYVCLRVPTGGGKTLMAAATVGVIADQWLRSDYPVILWLVPSDPILTQTLASLRDRMHPNRLVLSQRFGERVAVLDIDDALYAKPAVYEGTAVIIVCTIQAFRRESTEGRRVYAPNGELAEHFSVFPVEVLERLEQEAASGKTIPSLANVLRARRPGIIIDEAHNVRTQLSFETLGRLSPSIIIEYTATPVLPGKAGADQVSSNILVQVSAAQLRAENMVKLPVILRGRTDPRQNLADAIAWLEHLNEKVAAERSRDPSLAPAVMLIQAEPEYESKPSLHVGEVERILKEDFKRKDEEIAVSSGSRDDLRGKDLSHPASKVRFVVTQQRLREGWDCPSAYILCTVNEQKGDRSVEQLLGRVLRLPGVSLKEEPDLNRSYAFATSTDFITTASNLRDGLVECGYEEIEAEGLISVPVHLPGLERGGPLFRHEERLPKEVDPGMYAEMIANATEGRITIDVSRSRLVSIGPVSDADAVTVQAILPAAAHATIECLIQRGSGTQPSVPMAVQTPFHIPRLIVRDGALEEIFDKTHFLNTVWQLDRCITEPIVRRFRPPQPEGDGAIVDVEENGKVTVEYVNLLLQMPLSLRDTGWTKSALVAWLDRHSIGFDRMDIAQGSSIVFISRVIDDITACKNMDLPELVRAKYELRDALRRGVAELRQDRSKQAFQQALLSGSNLALTTSGASLTSMNEDGYAYRSIYTGPVRFKQHAFRIVGDLASAGEEHDCAIHLDRANYVGRWVRNTSQQKTSFWLQTSTDKFYPDFIAELNDGRYLVVEYKGDPYVTNDDSEEKRLIGSVWAELSNGSCVFVMVSNRDYTAIDRAVAAS